MEQVIPTDTENSKRQAQNKVTVGQGEFDKLTVWLKQLEETSKGFLNLSKSDLINFLIREHKTELGQKEMQAIRSHHYDPIRHLNWITPRLKEALTKNDTAQVILLQEEIRGIELSVIAKVTDRDGNEDTALAKPKAKKSKKTDTFDSVSGPPEAEIQDILSKS